MNNRALVAAPHVGPMACDSWAIGGGCPHFTAAHIAALEAAGQWPTTAVPVWPQVVR